MARVAGFLGSIGRQVVRGGGLVTRPPRVGPFRDGAFAHPAHDERPATWLGIALGIAFGVCFVTGLTSDLIQNPQSWFKWFPSPPWLFRANQGIHVFTGVAAIPLTLMKLGIVYPRLYAWPTVRGISGAIERLSIVPLVGGSLFLLITGVQNIAYWYPWGFSFLDGHYWAAWVTIGAIVIHVGAKTGVVARVWRTRRDRQSVPAASPLGGDESQPGSGTLGRRGVLVAAAGASGLLLATMVGETVPGLRRLAVLAPRNPTVGPQGFPVNKTARGAGADVLALDPAYRLRVEGAVDRPLTLALADLRARDLDEAVLTIACVEGWSATKRWRGVRLRDLVAEAGGMPGRAVVVESLQPDGPYRSTRLEPAFVADPASLLALDVEGEPLHLDHGFPLRLIVPNNPGVLQTKWVGRLMVE